MDEEYPDMSEEEKQEKFSSYLHDVIMSGYDGVVTNMKKVQELRKSILKNESI